MNLVLAPQNYIQERGLIHKVGKLLKDYGKRPLLVADSFVTEIVKDVINKQLEKLRLSLTAFTFGGECCEEEIGRVMDTVKKNGNDLIVGCGGGKAIDTAKAAAFYKGLPFVSFPTSAATCAAWSSSYPLYSMSGSYLGTRELGKTPDLVLVDTEVIARAPSRLLSSGMGDSLAKWYEGKTVFHLLKKDLLVDLALNLSGYLYRVIKRFGPGAKIDVDKNICSMEVDSIVQANILIAGLIGRLGGKNFRSAAAHAFNYALCGISKAARTLHGERVAIGILIQFILEGRKKKELTEILQFYRKIGLPCSMEELGVYFTMDELKEVSARVCGDSRIRNLPFSVDEDMFQNAFLELNNFVKKFTSEENLYDTIGASKKG